MNHLYRNTHLFHNIYTIFKRKHNTFLGCTNNMMFAMSIKIYSTDTTAYLLIIQHTFGTITEGKNADSCATYRSFGSQHVHFIIWYSFRCNSTFYPWVKDTCAVDTKQYSQADLLFRMIHVRKSVDTWLRIIIHFPIHSINNSWCACCRSNFTRIEHIQRKSIIRLVTGTISNGGSFF